MTTIKFFQAEWCGPCDSQKEIIDDIKDTEDDITVEEYDIEDNTEVANKYNVRSVPTMIVTEDDKVKDQYTGITPKEKLVT